jgi:cyclohexanone monooxygenase
MPSEKYTSAPEIFAHCRAIADHFDLRRRALLQTAVSALRWDDGDGRWHISTDRGDLLRSRFVVMAVGIRSLPKLPGVPGLETFRGRMFHASRWDYSFTGGDSNGNLTGLADKRVGVIGTGGTAVQCVPHLGEHAKHLYVFQRTPSSIDARNNRPTDSVWFRSLEPGWQRSRMENFTTISSGRYAAEDLVSDGWTDLYRRLYQELLECPYEERDLSDAAIDRRIETANFKKAEAIRARVDALVRDHATAEALKPYYHQDCKRPSFHDEFLKTFNRPNVTLVDTDGKGVERITERGVVAKGVEYEVDGLIFATGFEYGTELTSSASFPIVGRGGLRLAEKWSNGASTLHGIHSRGFPNCFIFGQVQSAIAINYHHVIDQQSRHLAYILKHAVDHGVASIETSQTAEDRWVETIVTLARSRVGFREGCTPSYLNNEGRTTERSLRNSSYGGGPLAYFQLLAEWRNKGDLDGLELTPRG